MNKTVFENDKVGIFVFSCEHAECPIDNELVRYYFRHSKYNLYKHTKLRGLDDIEDYDEAIEYIKSVMPDCGIIENIEMYEHSGVVVRLGGGKGWDNSLIGFAIISRVIEESEIEEVYDRIRKDLSQYSDYLNGEVYNIQVLEKIVCEHCRNVTFGDLIDGIEETYDKDEDLQTLIEQYDK